MTDCIGHMTYLVGQTTDLPRSMRRLQSVPDGNSAYRSGVPRKPYRSPREWLPADQQRLFGSPTPESLNWHTPDTELEEVLLAAAKTQSDLAFHIRASGYYIPTVTIATQADLHPDTVRDILNGSKHASLAALYALTAAVGRDLTVTTQPHPRLPSEGEPK